MQSFITFKRKIPEMDLMKIFKMASVTKARIFPFLGKTKDLCSVENRLLGVMNDCATSYGLEPYFIDGCRKQLRNALIYHINSGRVIYTKYDNPQSSNRKPLQFKAHCLLDLLIDKAQSESSNSVWYTEIDFKFPAILKLNLKKSDNDQTYTWNERKQ